ncbi:MAG: discoidin domain-containing protein, partial [bacterium]
GKPATASRTGSGEVPAFAVDGMVEVRSAFEPTFWGSAPYPQWWMVDLEKAAKLKEVHLYTYWGDGRYYQYTIDGSIDGKVWTTLVDASRNTVAADAKGYTHTFNPTPARYVRVTMLKNSMNQGVHIVELRVY